MIYPVGVVAALLLGVGYVLQQRAAVTAPISEVLHFRLLLDLMHRRVWWLGVGCMIVGELLSGFALQLASVGLVEPLLSTNLLFALALAALLARQRPRATELGGAVLLSAALGLFLGIGDPHGTHHRHAPTTVVMFAVVCVVVVASFCAIVGRRCGVVGEAIWLAAGAGLLFGLQDAATRAALLEFDRHGVTGMFLHIWAYVVLGSAVFGILLAQSAFRVARLDYSLPPITAAEPVAGIALGIALLGDRVSLSVPGLAFESACLIGLIAGVALIGRSPGLAAPTCDRSPTRPVPKPDPTGGA